MKKLNKYKVKKEEAMLLVVDAQERLVPAMCDSESTTKYIHASLEAARIFSLPVLITEQYPKGLGVTLTSLQDVAEAASASIFEKTSFSALTKEVKNVLRQLEIKQVILCGMETHVCVWQTAKALLKEGYQVFLLADAVCSRYQKDKELALTNMRDMGVVVTGLENLVFELLKDAKAPEFKAVSALVKKL